jgi:hypothetical protein
LVFVQVSLSQRLGCSSSIAKMVEFTMLSR